MSPDLKTDSYVFLGQIFQKILRRSLAISISFFPYPRYLFITEVPPKSIHKIPDLFGIFWGENLKDYLCRSQIEGQASHGLRFRLDWRCGYADVCSWKSPFRYWRRFWRAKRTCLVWHVRPGPSPGAELKTEREGTTPIDGSILQLHSYINLSNTSKSSNLRSFLLFTVSSTKICFGLSPTCSYRRIASLRNVAVNIMYFSEHFAMHGWDRKTESCSSVYILVAIGLMFIPCTPHYVQTCKKWKRGFNSFPLFRGQFKFPGNFIVI